MPGMNPFMLALQMAQSGQNPMQMLQNMAGSNPQLRQAMNMLNGKNPAQLRQVAQNMAKERGMDLEQFAQSIGLNLPK